MSPEEASARAAVVAAARSWIGTKYHHRAAIKGAGVDCATIIAACFTEAGVISPIELPDYSSQWHINRDEEKYTDFIRTLATEIPGPPLPADLVVWRFHRSFAHGGIVTEWPMVIHAFMGKGVLEDDAEANQMLATVSERTKWQGQPRAKRFFSPWP